MRMSTADNLKKRLSLAQIFTIPNIISMFRIVLILPMCWLYIGKGGTVVMFGIMAALMLFPQMESGISNGLIVTMTLTNAVCFALYAKFYYDIFRKQEDE